jgi:hypothetical protein
MASTAAHKTGSLSHTPHTVVYFTAGINSFLSGILEVLLFQRALHKLPSRDVYLKKEIIISFFIITISNLYMPMIR